MPAREKLQTVLRQWEMLRLLPKAPSPQTTAKQLREMLEDAGYEVDERTVQRDLRALSKAFPIDLQDRSPPYGWRWNRDARFDIPSMPLAEAVALELVEQHLRPLLPPPQLNMLRSLFEAARKCLEGAGQGSGLSNWTERVRVVPPSLNFQPPSVDIEVQDVLYEALLKRKQILADYENVAGETTKGITLNLIGLVQRGPLVFLIATAWDYQDVRQFALHRFQSAQILETPTIEPEGFKFDQYLASGAMEIIENSDKIAIKLCIDQRQARYLSETPLSDDQILKEDAQKEGWFILSATVNDTAQLRWWLRAHATECEVLEPALLRQECIEYCRKTIAIYDDGNFSGRGKGV